MPVKRATAAGAKASAPAKAVSKSASTKASAAPKKTATAAKKAVPSKKAKTEEPLDEPEATDIEEVHAEEVVVPAKKANTTKKTSTAKKPIVNGTAKTNKDAALSSLVQAQASKKRKVEDEDEADEKSVKQPEARPIKKAKAAAVPAPKKAAGPKLGAAINPIPSQKLDVFVFGEGSSGELGLGSKRHEGKKPIDVKRPRINHNLDGKKVGVVQLALGGMHAIALTHDNRILTWGVNDNQALGRDTAWEGGTRDIDAESDSEDEDDSGVNPHESTPGEVDMSAFPAGTKVSQVTATDSASFVVTEDGFVYGWGTFRGSEGIIGFRGDIRTQAIPMLIPELKKIRSLAAGSNHVLAMDEDGKVFTWGSGGQYQLGRKAFTRGDAIKASLRPEPCGRFNKKHYAVEIAAGSYHSFYRDNTGRIWAWGLNNYSQTGHVDDSGQDDAMVLVPKPVASFENADDLEIESIAGGEHHSVAVTKKGELLTWGRVDGHQVGHKSELYNEENAIFDSNGRPRILKQPTAIPGIGATFAAAGTDTSFVLDKDGKVYSWGFSANYQTGQGTMEDIETPTVIDNSAIKGRKIVWAGAGGQFSAIAALHSDGLPNGH